MHEHIAAGRHHDRVIAGDGIGERDRPCRRQRTLGTGFLVMTHTMPAITGAALPRRSGGPLGLGSVQRVKPG